MLRVYVMKVFESINTELVEEFMEAAQKASATVEKIYASPENLKDAIIRAMNKNDRAVLSEITTLSGEFLSVLNELPNVVSQPTEIQMTTIRVGITDAFVGIAHTGTVGVAIDETLSGSVSLFCREHIVILDAKLIIPKPRDIFSNNYFQPGQLPDNFVLIGGPSVTADMGELVWGVHGPERVHIILLE